MSYTLVTACVIAATLVMTALYVGWIEIVANSNLPNWSKAVLVLGLPCVIAIGVALFFDLRGAA